MNPEQFFNNKKVLIMGLGTKGGGLASARFAYKYGASVTITDLQNTDYLKETIEQLTDIPKTLILGQHRLEDFESHDIIIKNPGIRYDNVYIQHALKYSKIIETPISLFTKFYQQPYIGITGTKGKSYTTALVTHILSGFHNNVVAAGNNCVSPLEYLDKDTSFVLELSSWQLHEMGIQNKSPHIACWLNFFPDHMNYYAGLDDYFSDKYQITSHQTENDFLIVSFNDLRLQNIKTKAHKLLFSMTDLSDYELNVRESVCYVSEQAVIFRNASLHEKLLDLSGIKTLYAPHQLELVLASICITVVYTFSFDYTFNHIKDTLKQQLSSFQGLEYRFNTIYRNGKLLMINDSAASTPNSTMLALKACSLQPVVLIIGGGSSKKLNYCGLANLIVSMKVFIIFYSQDETSQIMKLEFKQKGYSNHIQVNDLLEAVQTSLRKLNYSGTVLFSPACSGFPVFKDMFDRGNKFSEIVQKLL